MKRACAAAILLAVPALAAANGAVVSVEGRAALERGAQSLNVVEALPVQPGDTLTVRPQSKVQLQFDDDSLFTVPGATVLRVDAFDHPKSGPGKAVPSSAVRIVMNCEPGLAGSRKFPVNVAAG